MTHRLMRFTLALGVLAASAVLRAQAPPPTADALFTQPYTDVDEWRDTPVRHRYVHGGFTGTDTRFSIYPVSYTHLTLPTKRIV